MLSNVPYGVYIHIVFVALVGVVVWFNRVGASNPKLPLIALGLVLGLWVLFSVFHLLHNTWHGYKGMWLFSWGSLFAVCSSVAVSCVFLMFIYKSQQIPPIHDISSDLSDVPVLSFAASQRHPSHNSIAYPSSNSDIQRQHYPDIQPLWVNTSRTEAMNTIERVVKRFAWKVYRVDRVEGVLEAYDETAIMRFVDDVVIRVQEVDQKIRIDMRSASRIGQSDFGANAQRIRDFQQVLSEEFDRK